MTPEEYRAALKALGLSQHRAAAWLGVAPRTSQAWALGEHRIPQPVATVIRIELERRAAGLGSPQ